MGLSGKLTTKAKAHVAAATHRWPAKKLNVILVTGADGGRLTAVALAKILTRHGNKVGVITPYFIEIGGERAMGSDQADILGDPFRLNSLLAQMRSASCQFVVIDLPTVLPAHKFAGITPLMVVQRRCGDRHINQIANAARQETWRQALGLKPQMLVLNHDDPCYSSPQQEESTMSFGAHERADCRIVDVKVHPKGSAVKLLIDHQTELELITPTTGKTAIYSLVAAACGAYLLHIPINTIEDGIEATPPQSAELQYVPIQRPYQVTIDGTTTPEGIEETLDTLKHFAKNRLIAVLSSNLAMAPETRPMIGELVANQSDRIIITSGEYSANDSPQTVRDQFLQGVLTANAEARTEEIADRREALEKALSIARRNDIVVILACTLRPYRQLGHERTAWSDAKQIEELMA